MENNNNFELIVTVVNRGYSDAVVTGARNAGARGGTIIYGRGTSDNERDSIMGVSIEPEKELIMTLTKSDKKAELMQAICESGKIDEPGVGICFSLPVTQVRGISSFKNKEKSE